MLTKRALLAMAVGVALCSALAAAIFAGVTSAGGAAVPATSSAASEMSVFSAPRHASDTMPEDISGWATALQAGAVSSGSPPSEQPGAVLTDESRLIFAGQGSPQADLYAVPTESGEACYVLSLGGATCVKVFAGMSAVGWSVSDADAVGSGSPPMVFGLAPDSVSAVDVVVNGVSHSATLKNNGFFYQMASGTVLPSAITAINVTSADGTSTKIALHLMDPPK